MKLVMATAEQYRARIGITVPDASAIPAMVVDLIQDVMDSSGYPEDKLDQIQNILTAGELASRADVPGATCRECGEHYPCSQATRTDIYPHLRALHVIA